MRGASIGWKIELELGNKQDLLEIGKAKLGGDHGNQYKKVPSLSKNDKVATPPHNTRAIIAESCPEICPRLRIDGRCCVF